MDQVELCMLVDIVLKFYAVPSNPGRFGLGCFGQFWGWVVSALVGGSFWPIFWVSRFGSESFRSQYMEIFR